MVRARCCLQSERQVQPFFAVGESAPSRGIFIFPRSTPCRTTFCPFPCASPPRGRRKSCPNPSCSSSARPTCGDGGGVGIDYLDETGYHLAVKKRCALKAKDGSYWPKNTALSAYGRWKIHEAADKEILFLVEGESDCWALWHHDLPALGLPEGRHGQDAECRPLGQQKVHPPCPCRAGPRGTSFQGSGAVRRLVELRFEGQVLLFGMPAGIKDVADLHVLDPDRFLSALEIALSAAKPASLALLRTADATTVAAGERPLARQAQPQTVVLADVNIEKVAWLWPGRIPLGKLTILDGDPGLGKSTITLDVAARLTCGLPMPACAPVSALPPAKVILMSTEDGLGDTIRPRLEAAGAQLDHVISFNAMEVPIEMTGSTQLRVASRAVSLPFDIPNLERVIVDHVAKLVVIDPLMAFLDESVHAHNDQSVRRALWPLCQMAERTGAAILVVRHLNKQPGRNVIYRGGGSIGIIGAVRSGLIVCKDPDAPHQRLLGVTKSNLCRPAKALRYELVEAVPAPRISWLCETDSDLDEVFAALGEAEPQGAGAEAEDFLRKVLAKGPVPVKDVFAQADEQGIHQKTLKRAKTKLNVGSRQTPATILAPAHWEWHLAAA